MVRILIDTPFNDRKHYIEAAGLSTDTKPSEKIVTGSRYIEVDSGTEYRFDEISGQWYEKEGVEM
jgi:hypothetical protein